MYKTIRSGRFFLLSTRKVGIHFKKNNIIISYMQWPPFLPNCLLRSQNARIRRLVRKNSVSGIKWNLLILAGFLVDNFEEIEVTGEHFVAIFDQGSACGWLCNPLWHACADDPVPIPSNISTSILTYQRKREITQQKHENGRKSWKVHEYGRFPARVIAAMTAVESSWITLLCKYNISLIPVSPWPQPFSYPLFCMQLLKHVANAMQYAEGFVLKRALVGICS